MIRAIIIFHAAVLFISCGTFGFNNTSQFGKRSSLADLNGYYRDRASYVHIYGGNEHAWSNYVSILELLNIDDYAENVEIRLEAPDRIGLTYHTDSIKKDTVLYGKSKGSFFEIYFKKEQIIIPLIYSFCCVDRVRIGCGKNGGLVIEKFAGSCGNILFLAGGAMPIRSYVFNPVAEDRGLTPRITGDKWGYVDRSGDYVIPSRYEFACRFELGVARVKADGKWKLIDAAGESVTCKTYEWISPVDTLGTPCFIAFDEGKIGVLGIDGNENIPVGCDDLDGTLFSGYSTFRIGDLAGIATRDSIVYPAMFSEINRSILWWSQGDNPNEIIAEAKKDGRTYMIDKYGYGYEIPNASFWNNKVDWKNKIKIL